MRRSIIGVTAWFYYLSEVGDVKQKAEAALSAVADLKVAQIANWRNERLGDGRFFFKAPFVAKDIQRLQSDPHNPVIRSEILTWLTLLKAGDRYEMVALFDTNHVPLLSVPDRSVPAGQSMRAQLDAALAANAVVMTDLHQGSNASNIHLEITFPVFAPAASGSISINNLISNIDFVLMDSAHTLLDRSPICMMRMDAHYRRCSTCMTRAPYGRSSRPQRHTRVTPSNSRSMNWIMTDWNRCPVCLTSTCVSVEGKVASTREK